MRCLRFNVLFITNAARREATGHSEILPNGFFACAKKREQEKAMRQGLIEIAGRLVGDGQAVFVIAEIGINHNGSIEIAKKMIDGAKLAGCDAVKFQKRTPSRS